MNNRNATPSVFGKVIGDSLLGIALAFAMGLFILPEAYGGEAQGFVPYVQNVPPYTESIGEVGKSRGLIIEIVEHAFKDTGLKADLSLRGKLWPELQDLGKQTAGSLIAPFARTPQREKNFRWVTPILEDHIFVFTKEASSQLNSFAALKSQASIGVSAGSASESRLKELKIPYESFANSTDLMSALLSGKLKAAVSQQFVTEAALKELGAKSTGIKRSDALLAIPLWVATSLKTNDTDFLKARHILEEFKKTAAYKEILSRYAAN